jgi:hypothetical protein
VAPDVGEVVHGGAAEDTAVRGGRLGERRPEQKNSCCGSDCQIFQSNTKNWIITQKMLGLGQLMRKLLERVCLLIYTNIKRHRGW